MAHCLARSMLVFHHCFILKHSHLFAVSTHVISYGSWSLELYLMGELCYALWGCKCLHNPLCFFLFEVCQYESYWNTECPKFDFNSFFAVGDDPIPYVYIIYVCLYIFLLIVLAWFLLNSPVSHDPQKSTRHLGLGQRSQSVHSLDLLNCSDPES